MTPTSNPYVWIHESKLYRLTFACDRWPVFIPFEYEHETPDRARHEALNEMTREVQKSGLYDKIYIPEE